MKYPLILKRSGRRWLCSISRVKMNTIYRDCFSFRISILFFSFIPFAIFIYIISISCRRFALVTSIHPDQTCLNNDKYLIESVRISLERDIFCS